MPLDWSNERYVRLYTRDTTTWKLLSWQARTLLMHLLRKVDRSGVLDVGDDGRDGLAAVVDLPPEIVEAGLGQLTHRGVVLERPGRFVFPNFLAAQEAIASDRQRQRDSRERRRALAVGPQVVTPCDTVTAIDPQPVTPCDQTVTRGHAVSRAVTPSLAVPSDKSPPTSDSCATSPRRVSGSEPDIGEVLPLFAGETSPTSAPEPRGGVFEDSAATRRLAAAERLWSRQEAIRRTLNPKARVLETTGKTGRERLRRVIQLLADGWTEDQLLEVLEVYGQEAKASGTTEWLNGESNWRRMNVDRTYGRIGTKGPRPPTADQRARGNFGGSPERHNGAAYVKFQPEEPIANRVTPAELAEFRAQLKP